jgi:hypothetical protein
VTDWPTISQLATAGATLLLAVCTYASVRSANRAARTAERSLLAGLRPLLLASHSFIARSDGHWLVTTSRHWNVDRPIRARRRGRQRLDQVPVVRARW